MEDRKSKNAKRNSNNKFICSICLNTRVTEDEKVMECGKRKSRSCPICYNKEYKSQSDEKNKLEQSEGTLKVEKSTKTIESKNVQTSQTDINRGLNLLNEVLAVFQNKKLSTHKEEKIVALKDACTTTDVNKHDNKPKLSLSRTFQYSIRDEKATNDICNFMIVHYCQPRFIKCSHYSIDLLNRKSSSIPQMKLEELKMSLKEKTKSKDAFEEINRMFATVKKLDTMNVIDDVNRPVVRNGPRVLPVVKTRDHPYQSDGTQRSCKCCQTTDLQMSSGDSLKLCQNNLPEKCDKCVYMMRCHYHRKQREMQANIFFCECCKNKVTDNRTREMMQERCTEENCNFD